MLKITQALVVEGKYDKMKLSSFIDGLIVETAGFGIFKNKEKLKFIKKLAQDRGIIILTDSDSAGFIIRNYLNSAIKDGAIFHAYIPDIQGKEKRKATFSKEGKLGVEGLSEEILRDAIMKSGVSLADISKENVDEKVNQIRLQFYKFGLYGTSNSSQKREKLKKFLDLPEHMTVKSMIKALSLQFSEEQIEKMLGDIA